MVAIVRIDLDKFDALFIAKLYAEGLITLGEATEAKCARDMDDVHRLLWTRQIQDLRWVRRKEIELQEAS